MGRLSVSGVRTLIRFEEFVIAPAALPGSQLINIFYETKLILEVALSAESRLLSDQHKYNELTVY